MKGKLIIISAPSGSGKTTIVNHLLQKNSELEFSISATSREPRGDEKEGINYYFLSPEEFREKTNKQEFVEWEEVYKDKYYGTLKSELERIWNKGHHVIFDVDVKGAINLKKQFEKDALAIFIKVPDFQILEKRLRNRNTEDEQTLKTRLEKAAYETKFIDQFDEVVVNENLQEAVKKTESLVRKFIES